MIKPLGDKVIVEPQKVEEETSSGIILARAQKEKPNQGVVVSVGPGRPKEDGSGYIPMEVKVGDKIIFSRFAGVPIEDNGKEYLLIFERDIIAVIE